MKTSFDEALEYLFENEGSAYSNHPYDSGGPTKYGVTLRAYSAYLKRVVSPKEISELTPYAVYPFYLEKYWSPLQCGLIEVPARAIALFDTGVLYGIGTAAVLAQTALKRLKFPLKLDGIMGDKSLTALNETGTEEFIEMLHSLLLRRIELVIKLAPKNEVFHHGWTTRANRLLTLRDGTPFNRGDT